MRLIDHHTAIPTKSHVNPNNPKSLRNIKKILENLKTSNRMKDALGKVKFINCKQQAPNNVNEK